MSGRQVKSHNPLGVSVHAFFFCYFFFLMLEDAIGSLVFLPPLFSLLYPLLAFAPPYLLTYFPLSSNEPNLIRSCFPPTSFAWSIVVPSKGGPLPWKSSRHQKFLLYTNRDFFFFFLPGSRFMKLIVPFQNPLRPQTSMARLDDLPDIKFICKDSGAFSHRAFCGETVSP